MSAHGLRFPALSAVGPQAADLGLHSVLDRRFGVRGDGSDETAALQAAMSEVGALKGALLVPPTSAGYGHSAPLVASGDLTLIGLGPGARFVALAGFPSTYTFRSVSIAAPQLILDRFGQTLYTTACRDLYLEGSNLAPVGLFVYSGANNDVQSCAARNHTNTNVVMCAVQNSSVRNVRTANATNYNFRYVNSNRNNRINIHGRNCGIANVLIDLDATNFPDPFSGLVSDLTTFEGGVWEGAVSTSKKSALWIKNAQNMSFDGISPTAATVTLTEALIRIDAGDKIHFRGPLRGNLGNSRVPILQNNGATGVRFGAVYVDNIGSSGNAVPRLFVSTQPLTFDDPAPSVAGFFSRLGIRAAETLASVPTAVAQTVLFGAVTAAAVTFVSATVLRRVGTDETLTWTVGRRVQAVGTATGTITGVVVSSTLNGSDTDITVLWDLAASPTSESLTLAGLSDLAASAVYEVTVWRSGVPGTYARARVLTSNGSPPVPSIVESSVSASMAAAVSGNDIRFTQSTGGAVTMLAETRRLA
jgi:hypothetical protein